MPNMTFIKYLLEIEPDMMLNTECYLHRSMLSLDLEIVMEIAESLGTKEDGRAFNQSYQDYRMNLNL